MKAGLVEANETASRLALLGVNRGIAIADLILRIVAIGGTLGSALAMGITDETLLFPTQFGQFSAKYDDFPTFTFFVIANSAVCAYLTLSISLSIYHIIKTRATKGRVVLTFFDTGMLALLTAGASAAAATVYLAHEGNASATWFAICPQFNSFCKRISGSLIGSFVIIIVFVVLILLSSIGLSRL